MRKTAFTDYSKARLDFASHPVQSIKLDTLCLRIYSIITKRYCYFAPYFRLKFS